MILPNFLIVGAQKAGTTSLHDIISQHPQANMSSKKEINFFTYDSNFKRGLDYYSSFFFEPTTNQIITGESSPGYMCFPGVAERKKKDLGIIKIVMILRDPIKRAFSQYWDNRRHLSETLSEKEIINLHLNDEYIPGRRGYFSRGVYLKYIKQYEDLFGKENLHILLLEELIKDSKQELRKLYKFLGLDETMGLQELPQASNSATIWKNPLYLFLLQNPEYTRFIPRRMRRLLFWGGQDGFRYQLPDGALLHKVKDFYNPWNEKLANILNKDLNKFWE